MPALEVHPETYLARDERVIALLARLSQRFTLFLYTNNNRALAARIAWYRPQLQAYRRAAATFLQTYAQVGRTVAISERFMLYDGPAGNLCSTPDSRSS